MRRLIAACIILCLPGIAAAGSETWAADLHGEAMRRAPDYANIGRSKVMVACVRWPEPGTGDAPSIAFAVTRVTSQQSDSPVPTNRLRRNAMSDCLGRERDEGCDCAVIDENGRNVLRIPSR